MVWAQASSPRRQVVAMEKVLGWDQQKRRVITSGFSSLVAVNVDLNLVPIRKMNINLSNEKCDHQQHGNSINAAMQAE